MSTKKKINILFQKIPHSSKFDYLLWLIPSYVLFALVWHIWIDGTLFYCSDPIPFLDFVPPFIHDSSLGADYWIASKSSVYFLWYLFLFGVFSLPALIIGLLRKKS